MRPTDITINVITIVTMQELDQQVVPIAAVFRDKYMYQQHGIVDACAWTNFSTELNV